MEIKILNKRIPFGAFGRNLTSAECKALRKHGVSCSESWIVNRRFDNPCLGTLWYPSPGGAYNNSSILLETKD